MRVLISHAAAVAALTLFAFAAAANAAPTMALTGAVKSMSKTSSNSLIQTIGYGHRHGHFFFFARQSHFIAWKLCITMKAEDVMTSCRLQSVTKLPPRLVIG